MKDTKSIRVSKKAHKKLRLLSAQTEKTVIQIVDELIVCASSVGKRNNEKQLTK